MAESAIFEIPEDVCFRMHALSAAENVAFSTLLAAASAALLHKYNCEGTLAIRTTSPERPESGIGLLPVDAVIANDPSFEQMLSRARDVLPNRPEGPDVEILIPPEFQHVTLGQRLTLAIRRGPKSLQGTFNISDTRLVQHLQILLRGLTTAPNAPLSTVDILGEAEARQILIDWNQTDSEYSESCVPELFDQQVQRTPHAVALIQGEQRLTYSQLSQQSNRLANYLRKRGVGPEVPVGLCTEQSPQAVVAVLAILKAGGAYVPLDASYPDQRLKEIVSDSKLAIAVTSVRFRDRVPNGIETVCMDTVYVDRDSAAIAVESPAVPAVNITPDNAAYILYTSASTGKPKGVVGVHRSIVNGLKSVNYAANEVCCLNTFLSYGFSLANMFLPLMSGVPLVVLTDEQIRDSNRMMTVLEQEGVTRIVLVPSVLKQIFDPEFGASSRLRKITTVGVAGGKLTLSHAQRLRQVMPQAKLYNRYASTEIGTVAAMCEVTEELLAAGGELPIGRPVANTRIYILDRYGKPVPVGVPGEICVSARHLARGYLHRPDLAAEKFIPDTLSAESGRRLYRTGDLGRFRSSGEIELVGRTDDQVKINGFRIDLSDVELALRSHSGVSEAVTAVREIGNGPRLVAYVVAKPIGTPSASQLRRYLQDRLAGYMIPARFVFLKDLPMLSNGKIDRNALPSPEPVRPNLETAYRPPGNPMELAIAQIWGDLLGLDPVGTHDHFRDLGGDSMSAAEVAVQLHKRFGIDITPEALLDRPTIAELATYLGGTCPASASVAATH